MNTAQIKELTPEQIKTFENALQKSIDLQVKPAFGDSPKFDAAFNWSIPAPKKAELIGIMTVNCI